MVFVSVTITLYQCWSWEIKKGGGGKVHKMERLETAMMHLVLCARDGDIKLFITNGSHSLPSAALVLLDLV